MSEWDELVAVANHMTREYPKHHLNRIHRLVLEAEAKIKRLENDSTDGAAVGAGEKAYGAGSPGTGPLPECPRCGMTMATLSGIGHVILCRGER